TSTAADEGFGDWAADVAADLAAGVAAVAASAPAVTSTPSGALAALWIMRAVRGWKSWVTRTWRSMGRVRWTMRSTLAMSPEDSLMPRMLGWAASSTMSSTGRS